MYHKFKEQDVIHLWGTGRESRDFIFIDDIIQAIDLTIKNSSFDAQVVNVANGKQLTIKEVSDAFVSVLQTDKRWYLMARNARATLSTGRQISRR